MRKIYSISKNTMLNEVESQGVVFYQGEEGEKIYYLNDTSLAVIAYLQKGKRTIEEIIFEILRLFDVGEDECTNDVIELLNSMVKFQIIEENDE